MKGEGYPEMRLVRMLEDMVAAGSVANKKSHIPPELVVERVTAHRKPPDVRICTLRNQSLVGKRPPSTSTPYWPACLARR
jgi:hypothetical protein